MIIEEPSLSEVKKIALDILSSGCFNKYFSMRQLRDEVVIKNYGLELRDLQHDPRYKNVRLRIGKQLVYLFREFKKQKIITKYSNRFWTFQKENIKEYIENEDGEQDG